MALPLPNPLTADPPFVNGYQFDDGLHIWEYVILRETPLMFLWKKVGTSTSLLANVSANSITTNTLTTDTLTSNNIISNQLTINSTVISTSGIISGNTIVSNGGISTPYFVSVGNTSVNTYITPGTIRLNGSELIVGNNVTISAANVVVGNVVVGDDFITINSKFALTSDTAGVANDALYLGGIAANQYLTISNNYTISGQYTFVGNLVLGSSSKLFANNLTGTSGQILYSNNTGGAYWGDISGGNGYTGSQGDTGFTGSQGDLGYAGSSGFTGSQGDTGFVGSQGNVGFTGSTGFDGSKGDIGFVGSQGNDGYTGSSGFTGSKGDTGFVGSQGETGFVGSQGNTGFVGSQGNNGYTGSQGDIGFTGSSGFDGSRGDTGFVGSTGFDGSQGNIGFTGSTGFDGSQGNIGYTGSQGNNGYTGSQGDIGYTGSIGVGYAGSKGDTGFTGSQGKDGSFGGAAFEYIYSNDSSDTPNPGYLDFNNSTIGSATVLYIPFSDVFGSNSYSFLLTIDDSTSLIKGHFSVVDKTNTVNYSLFTINGSITTHENHFHVPISYVSGITTISDGSNVVVTFARTGDIGDTGYVGSKGDTGYTGSQGNDGYTGSQGNDGYTGSTGFVGSQGNTGFTGSQGNIGFTGSTGYDGSKGDTGFTGSQGNDGYTGSFGNTGFVGSQGNDGYTGSTGFVGSKGDTGFTGSFGNTGFVGSQGNDGYTGSTGFVGSQGNDGYTGSQGNTGFVGSQGDTGYTGSAGFTGSFGNTGFTGSIGSIGFTGSIGSIGFTGSAGQGVTAAANNQLVYRNSTGTLVGSINLTFDSTNLFVNGNIRSSYSAGDEGGQFELAIPTTGTTLSGPINIDIYQNKIRIFEAGGTNRGAFIDFTSAGAGVGTNLLSSSTGYAGSQGATGFTGSTGYVGSQGNDGYTGSTGFVGSKGDNGFTGSIGIGYTGSAGGSSSIDTNTQYTFANVITFTNTVYFTGSNADFSNVSSLVVPTGNTGLQPSYTSGAVRYNIDTHALEFSNTTSWTRIGAAQESFTACTITTDTITSDTVTTTTGVIELLQSQSVTVNSGISVGNTTVNTSINAISIFSGNTTANAQITYTQIAVSNTLSNSYVTPLSIFTGNTTANASFNLTGGSATFSASRLSVNGNGAVIIQTNSDHGLNTLTGVFGALSNFDRSWLNNPRLLLANTPTPNTISFTIPVASQGTSLKINAVKRVNGLMTYETGASHNLLINDAINVTGIPSTIDSGIFNVVRGIVNTTPTPNTFTIYDGTKINKTVISSNTITISTAAVSSAVAATVYLTVSLDFSHGLRTGEFVSISNVTGTYGGGSSVGSILGTTYNLNGVKQITSVTSNTFQILAFSKPRRSFAVPGGSGTLTYSGTFNAVVNNDIANTRITTSAYSSLPIISNIPIANGVITYTVPIYINVGNTVSATKITPTSIFVGDLAGNSVIIDSAGTRYKRTGSILQTTVDGAGFGVTSVLDDGGTVDPEAAAFIANTSVISLGNTTFTTVITQEAVYTSNVFVGIDNTKINITQDTISIEDNTSSVNTTITNSLASFPNDLFVGSALYVNAIVDGVGTFGTDGQVLISNSSGGVYWSALPYINALSQSFTGDGSSTVFNLSTSVSNANNILVTLDGLVQIPSVHYTISGTTLTFLSSPLNTTVIEVRNLESGIGGYNNSTTVATESFSPFLLMGA